MKTASKGPGTGKLIRVAAYVSINLAAFLFFSASLQALGQSLSLMPLHLVQELAAMKSLFQGFGY